MFGHVDIVAVAPGRIVVSDNTKTVQPLEASLIRRVLVKDGDEVEAGQVLVELDATNASADAGSVQEQLDGVVSEALRTQALLDAIREGRSPTLPPLPAFEAGGDTRPAEAAALIEAMKAQLQAEWHGITAKSAKFDAELAHRRAEIATVQEQIAKLDATVPMVRQREADFKALAAQGFMSSHAGQDKTRERVEQEAELAAQRARLVEARAAVVESQGAAASYRAETRRMLNDRLSQATLKKEQLLQERRKTDQRTRLTRLTAPVSGTVQQLAVHTEGGVVTPARALLIIVPRGAQVTAEVQLENKDIGFVAAGQPAVIKLETFPFTRYGTVDARVKKVTADTVPDEKNGAIFPATLTLMNSRMDIDGRQINVGPGMNVTAEIKTGRRRVIKKSVPKSIK